MSNRKRFNFLKLHSKGNWKNYTCKFIDLKKPFKLKTPFALTSHSQDFNSEKSLIIGLISWQSKKKNWLMNQHDSICYQVWFKCLGKCYSYKSRYLTGQRLLWIENLTHELNFKHYLSVQLVQLRSILGDVWAQGM